MAIKEIFKGVIVAVPVTALVLYFAFSGKQEVKYEQRAEQAKQELDEQRFEDQFQDAWNGQPGAKIREARQRNIAELEAEVKSAKAKVKELDDKSDHILSDMTDALDEVDEETKAETKARAQAKKAKAEAEKSKAANATQTAKEVR